MKMFCCRGKRDDPDAQWHNREREMRESPIYKLLDVKMGGKMVEVFEEEGVEALKLFCREHFEDEFLYCSGEGKLITHTQYASWRHLQDCKTKEFDGGYMEGSKDFAQDRFIRFKEHMACSKLEKRGVSGETILHLCFQNDTPVHTEIAKLLLHLYPKLALDMLEGEEHHGQTALHQAIVNGDLDSVKLLVDKGADINQPATGSFFLPEDQKRKRKKNTDYNGYAYYGEFPLSFAACFGHESIYDYLLRNGADPDRQDSNGNTVLHMIVINNQCDMYSYAVRHHVKPANTWIKNGTPGAVDRLSPLALASKLGRQQIFNEIMELHRIELWRYSNIGCSLYPLHAVDSIGINGHTNWNSALMVIVNGETDDHLELLQGGVIRQLLDEKWKTFVRKQFFMRMLLVLIHLLFLTIAIYMRPHHDLVHYENASDGFRFTCEILTVLSSIANYLMHIEEVRSLGMRLFFVNLKNAPSKALYLISSALIILCVPVRLAHFASEGNHYTVEEGSAVHMLQTVEETMLVIAVPCAWCMLLFFAKGHSLTGTSVMMFYKILIGDIVRFLVIYIGFLICFSQAFYFLYKDVRTMPDGTPIEDFKTFGGSVMSLIHMTFGDFNYNQFDHTIYPEVTMIFFVIFMLLMPVLLLNMLIAMMGNTYTDLTANSEKEWIRQWAKIVMVLERAFSKDALIKYQELYSIPVDNPAKNEAEHMKAEYGEEKISYRALMVIKASNKTMAKQRKDAISNWKWMLKETMRLIKDLKKSGYDGKIDFKRVFPDENEFLLYENALQRKVPSIKKYSKYAIRLRPLMSALSEGRKWRRLSLGLKKRSSGLFGGGEAEPDWTAAVEQLAWEKDLNLSTSGASAMKMDGEMAPLDQVDTPPDSRQQVSGPPTESTMVDYINDEELEAIIQQAEDFDCGTPNSKASSRNTRSLSNRQSDISDRTIDAILRPQK